MQNFSIPQRLIVEISNFKYEVYQEILIEVGDLQFLCAA